MGVGRIERLWGRWENTATERVLGESRTLANLQAAFRRAGLLGRLTALSPSILQGPTAY